LLRPSHSSPKEIRAEPSLPYNEADDGNRKLSLSVSSAQPTKQGRVRAVKVLRCGDFLQRRKYYPCLDCEQGRARLSIKRENDKRNELLTRAKIARVSRFILFVGRVGGN